MSKEKFMIESVAYNNFLIERNYHILFLYPKHIIYLKQTIIFHATEKALSVSKKC